MSSIFYRRAFSICSLEDCLRRPPAKAFRSVQFTLQLAPVCLAYYGIFQT